MTTGPLSGSMQRSRPARSSRSPPRGRAAAASGSASTRSAAALRGDRVVLGDDLRPARRAPSARRRRGRSCCRSTRELVGRDDRGRRRRSSASIVEVRAGAGPRARPTTASALMMSCSAVAMPTSVWTMSIGASEPTSILIFVMRFSSLAMSPGLELHPRLARAYTRSQYACSTELMTVWTLRTNVLVRGVPRVARGLDVEFGRPVWPKLRSSGWVMPRTSDPRGRPG